MNNILRFSPPVHPLHSFLYAISLTYQPPPTTPVQHYNINIIILLLHSATSNLVTQSLKKTLLSISLPPLPPIGLSSPRFFRILMSSFPVRTVDFIWETGLSIRQLFFIKLRKTHCKLLEVMARISGVWHVYLSSRPLCMSMSILHVLWCPLNLLSQSLTLWV